MPALRKITDAQRRAAMVRRHHLAGDAPDVATVVRDLLALHATDPGSVYLSVLARSETSSIEDVRAAMYERRELVRWLAMRRTLFVFDREDVPMVQASVSTPLAGTLRKRLLSRIERNGTEPAIKGDAARWLARAEDQVEAALEEMGSATGRELAEAVDALRTVILPRSPSEQRGAVTSFLLALMSAAGLMVRAVPTGAWTSRHHRWEPLSAWWPEGIPEIEEDAAASELARRWLERFGPAPAADLQWWTGWTKTKTAKALGSLETEEVDLDGTPGIDLDTEEARAALEAKPPAPCATLLPALDPTAMGWKEKGWFLAFDPAPLFDRAGNIGPTLWWDGEIVGGWAVAPSGEVRTRIVADRGTEARDRIEAAAAHLGERLDGAIVTPYARTPLERELSDDG